MTLTYNCPCGAHLSIDESHWPTDIVELIGSWLAAHPHATVAPTPIEAVDGLAVAPADWLAADTNPETTP